MVLLVASLSICTKCPPPPCAEVLRCRGEVSSAPLHPCSLAPLLRGGLRPDVDIPIVYTGIRPGEKLHEELVGDGEERELTSHPHIFRIRNGSTFNVQRWTS